MKNAIYNIAKRSTVCEDVQAELKEPLISYTMEELDARIAESEADRAAGRTYTTDEMREHLFS